MCISTLLASLLFLLVSYSICQGNIINLEEIVEKINSNLHNTWQADTYGFKEIDIKKFSKFKVGVDFNVNDSYARYTGTENHYQAVKITDFLPENYDAGKEHDYCRTIRQITDQSNCDSSWAMSSVDTFSDRLCLQSFGMFNQKLSVNYVTSCNKANYGCWGGYLYIVWDFLVKNGVITGGDYESDEGCQPYEVRPCGYPHQIPCSSDVSLTPKCRHRKCSNEWYETRFENKLYKLSHWYYVKNHEDYIKAEIYLNGPVVAYFYVPLDFISYKKGIYQSNVTQSHSLGYHSVRVIGWGIENDVKYWIAANSWGSEWGEDGFFRILRGNNTCFFEEYVRTGTPRPYFL